MGSWGCNASESMPAPTPSCPPAPPCHVEPPTLPRLWGHWPCHQDVRQAPADAQTVRKKSILGDHLHTPTHLLCKLRPRKAGQLVLRPGTTRSRNFQISFSPLIFPPWEGGRGQETHRREVGAVERMASGGSGMSTASRGPLSLRTAGPEAAEPKHMQGP